MLLPSNNAPIIRSRIANMLDTTAASRLPCFDSRNMLAREAPVSAVSLAEKNAETYRQAMTMESVTQSMARCSLHQWLANDLSKIRVDPCLDLARQPGLQKIADQRRLDVRGNHGTADRLQQDEGEPAALALLVLRHKRHQRVGVAKPFLGKSGDVLQMGRQPDFGKVTPDPRCVGGRDHAELRRQFRRQHHAD